MEPVAADVQGPRRLRHPPDRDPADRPRASTPRVRRDARRDPGQAVRTAASPKALAANPGRASRYEARTVIEVARQAGHAPSMNLDTYQHVIDELDSAERVPAEEQVRRARASRSHRLAGHRATKSSRSTRRLSASRPEPIQSAPLWRGVSAVGWPPARRRAGNGNRRDLASAHRPTDLRRGQRSGEQAPHPAPEVVFEVHYQGP